MSSLAFRPRRARRKLVLNVTSLIDVLFLLLIFFMLTSTFRRAGELQLELPESSTATPAEEGAQREPTQLVLRADGSILLDGIPVPSETLPGELRARVASDPAARVVLNAEAAARHADVVRLLDEVREAGYAGVSIGTEMRGPRGEGER